ncbi:MAG TPA: Uma2 family endonuclease, partial [Planctomycetota bacterium]|nr:Uma2 family endonuclease [Planctomycetota bacterium]
MSSPTITTAEQLLSLREPGCRHELVRGELRRMSPAGYWHGGVGMRLAERLARHVRENRLGLVFLA